MQPPEVRRDLLDALPDEHIETAYAKINLALHVRARRADGYHAIESLFVFAEDGDWLAGVPTDDGAIDLTIDGPFGEGLGAGQDNLVMQAARALQSYLGEQRGAALRLTKRLPVASGIGGGSADAAATLRLLARTWDVRIDAKELAALALSLGSDVPACVASVTQLVRGRGELLEMRDIEGLTRRPILLVNPGVAVSTGIVFAGWDRIDRGAMDATSLDALIVGGRNDLEARAMALAPEIGAVLAKLRSAAGVRLARMSGSGATCFALFDDPKDAARAATALRRDRPAWWVMETRIRAA
ncbi:4-(cytidine 5'-diphospho)-2-C-methyl-D-erythritol kinase [Sphingobium sp. AN558]|uniref:4-(cytidine 5'-diphospho)-2-C-methyl-D-erythritol kinase n=1 Tax=Sphingobium sp. AN558 TaxID=3133442 RepID=UPI0030BEFB23